MKLLSIKQVNRLYLVSILLVLSLGTIFQYISFPWGLLATEILLILLPVLWLHKRKGISLKASAKLKRPRASVALVAMLLGSGAWLVDSIIDAFMLQIIGYIPVTPTGVIPTNWVDGILIFLGFAIAAPICEEILFRGTIQQAYHNEKNPQTAILVGGFMFVLFHFRFQGFLSLIPIALILGFIYWRTQSLVPAILAHFANNFMAAVSLIQAGLVPDLALPFPSIQAAAFGFFMVIVGLFLLNRLTQTPQPEESAAPEPAKGISAYWPILVAVLIFSVTAVIEVITGKPQTQINLNAEQLPQSAVWTYDLYHKGGEKVGQAACTLEQDELAVQLHCTRTNAAFEFKTGSSFYSSLEMNTSLDVVWDQSDLSLQTLSQTNQAEAYQSYWEITSSDETLVITLDNNGSTISETFPKDIFVEEEWPWRLMALSFDQNFAARFQYLEPLVWRQKTQDSGPVLNESGYLVINGQEEISTPAGTFQTWKVTYTNNQTAWYMVETPHTLVRLESRMFDYNLAAVGSAAQ